MSAADAQASQSAASTGRSGVWRAVGVAALAIILYAALVDAAIETFLSGSPVRWWVAGAVALYFALTLALWRWDRPRWERLGWSSRATAGFFVLLGVLTLTAWLHGGLTDGVRLLGQPTSTVLATITAAASWAFGRWC